MAEDLCYISGPFPVEEINNCLSTSGYAKRLHAAFLDTEENKGGLHAELQRQRLHRHR